MSEARDQIIAALWHGQDPFAGFPRAGHVHDAQGWKSDHPYLVASLEELRPRILVEVGVWKGGSTLTMARRLKALDLDAVVIAIDTWLGSAEHWVNPDWFAHLGMENGRSSLMRKFMGNVAEADLVDFVVPLPLDSSSAAHVLAHHGVRPDLVHIDGGHEYETVLADLKLWWPALNEGGLLIGDDYTHNGSWPGVRQAFDEFFPTQVEHDKGKCRVFKRR